VVASGEPPSVLFGAELASLAQAMATRWTEPPTAEREALVAAAGPELAERAIGVAATFQMMNRLLDGVGAPVNKGLHPLAKELGFEPLDIRR
jgi:hypothetical protein